MKVSEIKLSIELDKQNVPEKIFWEATDSPTGQKDETKAITLALWDGQNRSTMKIDLWVKDMPVHEMKLFYLEAIGGMAESLKSSTGDQLMFDKLNGVCKELMEHIQREFQKGV